MKNQDYIHEEYPKACCYCEKGSFSFDGEAILCEKKGVVAPDDCCKKFVYDPLKRVPREKHSPLSGFSAEDFSL